MKKNAIAVLLSFVLAAGSIGAAPVYAAETTAKEAANVEEAVDVEEEESIEEEVPEKIENADFGLTVSGDEAVQAEEEEPVEEGQEAEGSAEERSESDDIVVPEEAAEVEEDVEEEEAPVDEVENSAEVTGSGEPVVIEEETVSEEEKEAVQAGGNVVDSGSCGRNATWKLTGTSNNLTLTISGSGAMNSYSAQFNVDIEDYVPNTPWYSRNTKIRSIIIEEGITGIGTYSFLSCNNVTKVTVPESLTAIGGYAFWKCSSLTGIKLPEGLTSIGEYAFTGCSSLSSIIIPDGVKRINNYTFYNCGLKSVVIGNGVRSIGTYAFADNELSDIYIPATVNEIGGNAFTGNKITDITIPDGVTTVWSNAFSNCRDLSTVIIPDSVTSIGNRAFYNCYSLKNITIPDSVTNIGADAFNNCRGLTSIDISSNVEVIGESAFSGCALKEIHFGDLETLLKTNKDAGIRPADFYIGDELFTDLKIPDDVRKVAVINCRSLETVTGPDDAGDISEFVFSGCSQLRSVTIPDGITSIDEKAFLGCSSLKNIKIPDSVIEIKSDAFNGCKNLTDIDLPDSVEDIGENAFYESGLTGITIPEGMTGIYNNAFRGCNSLTKVSIPDTVKTIEQYAFGYGTVFISETGETLKRPKEIECLILYHGTKAQWENAVGNMSNYYKSVIFDPADADVAFDLEKELFNYTGKQITPSVKAVYNGEILDQGKDYGLTYENNVDLGKATVKINLVGKHSGTVSLPFTIRLGNTPKVTCTNVASGMKVSWVKVSGATRYDVYRNDRYLFTTSALAVTDKDVKYNGGKKYTYKVVAYARSCGYSDLFKTATYYRLMPVGIKSLTNPSAGKMTVTYDKSTGSSGYVVRYGLKSDMSDAKVITVQGANTLSRTFGGMKKGKTYYVQVRTYKIDNGVRYYSGYCTTKKITITK